MHALLAINWEPQIRGILIIIISVGTLCGSTYLILGTNIGARLGFLVALAGLSGWMMVMTLVWWTFGLGLTGERGECVECRGASNARQSVSAPTIYCRAFQRESP